MKASAVTVEEFAYASPEYDASRLLRRNFLRLPLGLELTEEDVADDANRLHFGLFDDGERELIGSVIGVPRPDLGEDCLQIRQMVVHEAHRERGNGRQLLLGAERLLRERGYTRLLLYARAEAQPFYERCGYRPVGEIFELIGVDHQRMEKHFAE